MTHTEGPWFAGHDDAEDCPDHAMSGLALVDTGRQGDWPIARLCEWNNVSLIVAAPDLLAVCKAFLAKLGPDGYYPEAGAPLTQQMREAVAKAESDSLRRGHRT